MLDESCNKCYYFESEYIGRVGEGECRKNPPVSLLNPTGYYVGMWPVIPCAKDGWCGEFRAIKEIE